MTVTEWLSPIVIYMPDVMAIVCCFLHDWRNDCVQVTVKERRGRFRTNPVLGEVVIMLDTFLQCPRQHTTSWYTLYSSYVAQLDADDSFWHQSILEILPTGDTSVRMDDTERLGENSTAGCVSAHWHRPIWTLATTRTSTLGQCVSVPSCKVHLSLNIMFIRFLKMLMYNAKIVSMFQKT